MPFSRWQRHRFIRPIRVLSFALGLLGLGISFLLFNFLTSTPNPPPIFKYALISLSIDVWCVLFFAVGLATIVANVLHRGARAAHSFGVAVWAWWAFVLTFATVESGLATSGYSYLCGIAALAYWVCAAYWDAENPRKIPHAVG
jgi:hypothetical protein